MPERRMIAAVPQAIGCGDDLTGAVRDRDDVAPVEHDRHGEHLVGIEVSEEGRAPLEGVVGPPLADRSQPLPVRVADAGELVVEDEMVMCDEGVHGAPR